MAREERDPIIPPKPEVVDTPVEVPVPVVSPTLSPGGLKVVGVTLAVAFLLVIGAMTWGYFRIQDLAHKNEDSISRLDSILKPTPAQYREQLKRGIRLCLNEPECRKLFPQIDPKKRQSALRQIERDQRRAILAARRKKAREKSGRQRVSTGTTPSNGTQRPSGNSQRPRPPRRPPPRGNPGGGTGGGGGGGSGGNPSPPPRKPSVARTPTVEVPATPLTPTLTVPSVEVPCQDLPPVAHC